MKLENLKDQELIQITAGSSCPKRYLDEAYVRIVLGYLSK